jgi:SAM-dependent methyltransferase
MALITETVRDKYAAVARSGLSNDSAAVQSVASAFGYSADELASLPAEANMGLSCGNPVALAALRPGEVVVDLGCGGGLDVLLAAKQVGPTGKAIGIDMTPEMIARAKAGAAKVGVHNVEFHQALIDQLPLPDHSVDCILSNCVINLAPDKPKVFREMLRVLKPGGRISISDIALRQPLPVGVANSLEAWVGCIAGAILMTEYERLLREAGFDAVVVTDTGADLNVYAQSGSGGCCSAEPASCCDASGSVVANNPADLSVLEGLAQVLRDIDANAYAASVRVYATANSHTAPQEHTIRTQDFIVLDDRKKVSTMKTIQIYDKPMCCSTGICGPQVDPVLPRFAADLDALKTAGHTVERYNLSQQPQAFIQNTEIHSLLSTQGTDVLPVVMVDGQVVSRGIYPSREMLNMWIGGSTAKPTNLPIADQGCCSGTTGCC